MSGVAALSVISQSIVFAHQLLTFLGRYNTCKKQLSWGLVQLV